MFLALNTDFAVFLLGRHTKRMEGVFIGRTTMGRGGGIYTDLSGFDHKKEIACLPSAAKQNNILYPPKFLKYSCSESKSKLVIIQVNMFACYANLFTYTIRHT